MAQNSPSHPAANAPESSPTPGGFFQAARLTSLVEAVSYLILLFIAMPLKYGFDQPQAVRMAGMAHGVLFILLVVVLALALLKKQITPGWATKIFLASLVPFVPFFLDKKLQQLSHPLRP